MLWILRTWVALAILAFIAPAWAESHESVAGKLLVAAPGMTDPRFAKTVIYMVEHDKGGAMGLVINRAVGKGPVADLLRGLGLDAAGATGDVLAHWDGPVGLKQGFVLHSTDYTSDGSIVVDGKFALTFDAKILRAIGAGRGPKHALFAFGYSGWGPGQLESEFRRNGWVVVPADPALVFEEKPENKWQKALDRLEVDL